MKRIKLSLGKKTITKLSIESLENVQGGLKFTYIGCCTSIDATEEDDLLIGDENSSIKISCKK